MNLCTLYVQLALQFPIIRKHEHFHGKSYPNCTLELRLRPLVKVETYLIFVQLTVLVLLLSLLLEGDNDEAHKYIHHEEGNKDEVDDKED